MVKVNDENTNNLIRIIKGTLISIVATLILLIIFSAILTYTNISESTIPTVIIVLTAIGILMGSHITTAHIRKNGIINGALVGGIYIIILYLISSIVTKEFSLNKYSIIMMATSLLIGALGGIIGVNRK